MATTIGEDLVDFGSMNEFELDILLAIIVLEEVNLEVRITKRNDVSFFES